MKLPVKYNDYSIQQRRLIRKEYIRIQKGNCAHCGKLLAGPPVEEIRSSKITKDLFPPGFFDHPIHLHHDHVTGGLTIGAIHAKCNAYLWEYKNE